jgi:hypothetical protein
MALAAEKKAWKANPVVKIFANGINFGPAKTKCFGVRSTELFSG